MRKGIKLFENLEKCYLEVCVPDDDRERFENDYAIHSLQSPKDIDGYNNRQRKTKYNAWGIEFRVYFKTSADWIVDSLKKLGFHTEISDKLIAVEFNNQHPQNGYKHRVSNKELFWWLIDYGYRLGENNAIPYDYYLMREALKAYQHSKKLLQHIDINQIEAENPTVEAEMLMEYSR